MKNKYILLTALLLSHIQIGLAQKGKLHDVHGSATVYLEDDMTPREAKLEVLRLAQAAALGDEFGAWVSATNQSYSDATNDKAISRFNSYGLTEVKGTWIKNNREPVYTQGYNEQLQRFWYRAEVWGKGRAINGNQINLNVNLLRNSREDTHASTDFVEGDRLRISITSPVDGHLAIYGLDRTTKKAYRVIPQSDAQHHQPETITANKRHLFMDDDNNFVILTCESERIDYMCIYVLFSPEPFYLLTDEKGAQFSQEELQSLSSSKGFNYNWLDNIPASALDKWMASLRVHDEQMQCIPINITIKRKN